MEYLTTTNMIIGVCLAALAKVKSHFSGGVNQHFPDLKGKIIMITGGNTGIGFESAKELALRNPAKIILACRDLNRGMKAVNDIKSSTGF